MDASKVYKYFPELNTSQKNQIEQLFPLYTEWNAKINVISRKDIDLLYERHILHSLSIAKFVEFVPDTQVLDLGTGGGFPGIPLAILFPQANFHLVDSISKKITVVKAVSESLGLKNLTAEHQRAEKINGQFDFVVSRAVAKTSQLALWTQKKIKMENKNSLGNGMILLKGGDLQAELREYRRPYSQTNIKEFFTEEFFETKKIIYIPIG